MVALNPKDRYTVEKIFADKWFTGETIPTDQVQDEQAFSTVVKGKKREAKAKAKENRKKRGAKNKEIPELQAWAELDIPDYDDWTNFSLTQFFYSVEPDEVCDPVEVFEALIKSLQALGINQQVDEEKLNKYQVDEEKLALKYTVIIEDRKEDGDGDEEIEENEEVLPFKVECSFDVSVTVCKKEEGKYCLDFILMKGDREAFIDHYEELAEKEESLLWPYNNATI